MSELLLEIILTGPDGITPVRYATPSLASPTLSLFCPSGYLLRRNEQAQIPLQISVTVPNGYYGLILPNFEATRRGLHVAPIALFQSENINILIENRGTINAILERYDILAELSVMPVIKPRPVVVSFPGESSQLGWTETHPSPASSPGSCSCSSLDQDQESQGSRDNNDSMTVPMCLR